MKGVAVLLSPILSFACVFFLVLALPPERKVRQRLASVLGQASNSEAQLETLPPLRERLLRPFLRALSLRFAKFTPQKQRDRIAAKLSAARMENDWTNAEWQALQYGLGFALALGMIWIPPVLHLASGWAAEIGVVGFLMGYLLPDAYLKGRVKKRMREITDSLPDVLDLVTISVEAGLGFDAALLKVVEKEHGVLAEEFSRVLYEIRMGKPRREALRDLARHNPIEDLQNLIASLVQADQLGIPMTGVLRTQAKQIRLKRRQRAEEQAQKAPIKILIPLVLFVFPSMFIVVLGPAVMELVKVFATH